MDVLIIMPMFPEVLITIGPYEGLVTAVTGLPLHNINLAFTWLSDLKDDFQLFLSALLVEFGLAEIN